MRLMPPLPRLRPERPRPTRCHRSRARPDQHRAPRPRAAAGRVATPAPLLLRSRPTQHAALVEQRRPPPSALLRTRGWPASSKLAGGPVQFFSREEPEQRLGAVPLSLLEGALAAVVASIPPLPPATKVRPLEKASCLISKYKMQNFYKSFTWCMKYN
ncbi:hypothetical protein PVAP13_5NG048008 [Panicum virgatum]|uniref:Uncharacterized protein n=1 Tax=Panicum virgatum TaxID=38727 RepID=A0A8T0RJX9_PANVG|nr:hypothetical protein PVAP13_5NG048008 [Panicum virgatum]